MDKNSVIGLILIGIILFTFSVLNAPSDEEVARIRQQRDSIAQVNKAQEKAEMEVVETPEPEQNTLTEVALGDSSLTNDSVVNLELQSIYGMFSKAASGDKKYYTIENELIKVTISSQGGRIVSAELKNYKRYDSTALVLFDEEHSTFNLNYFTLDNKNISTDLLYFEPVGDEFEVSGEDVKSFSMRLYDNSRRKYVEYIYSLKGNTFLLDMDLQFSGFNQVMQRQVDEIALNWEIDAPSQEKDMESQKRTTTVYYKYKDDDPDYISETSDDKEELVGSVKWLAFKQQYFTAAIIADDKFNNSNSDAETKTLEDDPEYVKKLSANLTIPFNQTSDERFAMSFYFGPLHHQTLESLDLELEKLIPLGWGIFGWVNEWVVIPMFNWLDTFGLSYGIIILLLTIIIKLFLFPITYKTYMSSARMKVLKPQITEINEKHKDDARKKQQAVMALYKKTGVNPFSGCIPMLIQFPILIAMFRFFPASIELRQESFLWATDLSSYDSILSLPFNIPFYGSHVSGFTLLMAISMVFYTRMNSSMSMGAGAGGEMQAAQMKIMMYLMPIMMLFFFNSYSSGLSYYYFIANVMSISQQFVIKKWFVDEKAILAKIEANKRKPSSQKKSKFQKKLEEMAKQRGYQPPKR